MDLGQGWPTGRLDLEPLLARHAAELAPVLDDPALHEFTGGTPLDATALTARYTRLASRRSADSRQYWGNWVIRVRETGRTVGPCWPISTPAIWPRSESRERPGCRRPARHITAKSAGSVAKLSPEAAGQPP
jgi:hypothetical protein